MKKVERKVEMATQMAKLVSYAVIHKTGRSLMDTRGELAFAGACPMADAVGRGSLTGCKRTARHAAPILFEEV